MIPVLGGGGITLDYGVRNKRYSLGFHTGRDYRARVPRPALATRAGRVVFVGVHGGWGASYGKHVIVDTAGVRHSYNHLSKTSVRVGQQVAAGQRVGWTGRTGFITGPHLHYEERYAPYRLRDTRNPRFDRVPQKVLDVSDLRDCARVEPGRAGCRHPHPAQVLEFRRLLRLKGYAVTLNGHYSLPLRATWRRFEKDHGLPPTGSPGPVGLGILVAGTDTRVRT